MTSAVWHEVVEEVRYQARERERRRVAKASERAHLRVWHVAFALGLLVALLGGA